MQQWLIWMVGIFGTVSLTATAVEVRSPDGKLSARVEMRDGCPLYRVARAGTVILDESRLGLVLEGGALTNRLAIVGEQRTSHDETWTPVYGERNAIRDHYNQLDVDLGKLWVTFRAYNEGVAFCYTIPQPPGTPRIIVTKEYSEFRFAADYPAWAAYSAQGKYEQVPLSRIKPGCERPLTVQVADDLFVALAEAKLVDYARMKFAPLAGRMPGVVSDLSGAVESAVPVTSPWRVVMVAESPGKLLENNFIMLNLNDPCALADTSWIKPGKVIREVTLTTAGSKACVDFAMKYGLQYVLFDAGWYGRERDPKSDARCVSVGTSLDLPEVIRYGKERGIGVILYVNRIAAERQLDEILPLYRKWGVKGVKFGFVNVGAQQWTSWLHMAIRKAAENQLMVDVHDEYRPTGYTRTYPNLMTVEGIGGDEVSHRTNEQSIIAQFTRFLAGPADNTVCYYNERVDRLASHAYQLAKAVCFYSPWQHLFWYDRPSDAHDEPELEFYKSVPTVWDETKVLDGRIGASSVIARRSGDEWFIGAMNSGQPRAFDVPLDFLEAGKKYIAHIYTDDPSVPTRTHVRVERQPVRQDSVLSVRLAAQGGQAIRIAPE